MANTRNKAIRGQDVILSIQYYGIDGLPTNADATPEVTIKDLQGTTVIGPTSLGVTRVDTGLYQYTYGVPKLADKGNWTDTWVGSVSGINVQNVFQFLIADEGSATAGAIRLGDDVAFDFSEPEILGINTLLKFLKARLRNSGKKPVRDQFGAIVYDAYGDIVTEECNVFSDDILVCFLCQALSEFNMVPFFTTFTFADEVIYKLFAAAIVEGAYVFAIASQTLVEKGRDFTISDGGLSYQPPALGDFLQSHYGTWLTAYRERLKFIKNSIRPGPRSFGTYSNMSSGSPSFTRLRHVRQRRIV
jgi:hypothetical protein